MPAYLDNNATTRVDARVVEAMLPYLSGPYGNASSLHRYGRAARDAVEQARAQVAALVNAQPQEIVWTSGGTEADNLAIKGSRGQGRVLYGATDHPAVMECAVSLGQGVEAIAVDADGLIRWDAFKAQLEAGPVRVVSAMRANNETGVIQDVQRMARLAQAAGALMHVDCVQAMGKLPLDFTELGCDLVSLSSHKIYGPKGAGALVVKGGTELQPLHHGGAQERGLRGGTENIAAIVGFGAAAQLAGAELEARIAHGLVLRERLIAGLREMPKITLFGINAPRLSNTVQFALAGYDGEALLMQLDRKGMAVSSGSACASGNHEPSHVLLAMGYSREVALGAIRVSFGKDNTEDEVDQFLGALKAVAP